MSSDLEERLARLEDREAIRELAVRYCYGVDGAQAQALAEVSPALGAMTHGTIVYERTVDRGYRRCDHPTWPLPRKGRVSPLSLWGACCS